MNGTLSITVEYINFKQSITQDPARSIYLFKIWCFMTKNDKRD